MSQSVLNLYQFPRGKIITLSNDWTSDKIDAAIRHNDAVESIRAGWTREQHLSCYKTQYHTENGQLYDYNKGTDERDDLREDETRDEQAQRLADQADSRLDELRDGGVF